LTPTKKSASLLFRRSKSHLSRIVRRSHKASKRRAEKTQGVSDQEIDAAIDEAVDHVRHSRG